MSTTRYIGKTLENMSFDVDECFFINCVLKNCDLFYAGGDFAWQDSRFENCRWQFRGPALRMWNLLKTLDLLKPLQAPPPVPVSSSKLN